MMGLKEERVMLDLSRGESWCMEHGRKGMIRGELWKKAGEERLVREETCFAEGRGS